MAVENVTVAISVRPHLPADNAALARLFEEMQRHYRVPCPPFETILADLATLPPGVEILVAETDRIIGFAICSTIYPGPGLRAGFFLKELFVLGPYRGSGAGRLLMQALARTALQRGHGRVDWTADGGNERLLTFYGGLGGTRQPDKVFFRLSGEALAALAKADD
ncbi:GNAT family N-acetyltransferase [Mesorhizobium huakuii]|uniref:GNAT family N-acetyltransferase n=2 Tax=Mesorhizobium huakuii TaxID=28104 RepID=A0ABZ0VMR4_9HYPH|nr:GNAT family N-acetyltransferase [Mesorhizobium huakuii]WQB98720.1 GNAT family N-acetyltransferase [Mesorhizobium huakuii]